METNRDERGAVSQDFSVVLGGPLYQLFRRAHLSGDALDLVRRRVVVIALVAWAPLFVLSLAGGEAFSGDARVPFFFDVEVHVRFLVALPLLVIAELVVHGRMRNVVRQFLERRLVPSESLDRFEAAIDQVFRLRNSVTAEILLLVFVYVVGILFVWRHYAVLDVPTWYTVPAVGRSGLSPAGLWYVAVAMPIFQFLLVRWYFRVLIWVRFLWQVSRIELSLVPTHPDTVGGLGFLGQVAYAFAPIALAHGAVLSGMIANRILHFGAHLTAFKVEIAVVVVFVECLALAPLLLFGMQLAATKRRGLAEYGALAERYVRAFDEKWIKGGAPREEPLLGSADVQSLADLGNGYQLVRAMRPAPVTKEAVIQLGVATLAPVAPLLATIMPLEALVAKLLGILL